MAPNQARNSRRRQNTVLTSQNPRHPVGGTNPYNQLASLPAEEPTVTTDHQRGTGQRRTIRVQNALDKVLRVVLLGENFDLTERHEVNKKNSRYNPPTQLTFFRSPLVPGFWPS